MIRTFYPAADFLVPFVKALASVRRRVLRERGIDAIKIAPMSARAVAVRSSMGGPAPCGLR
jgi:hypothetical protein